MRCAVWSPDGARLASGDDGGVVKIWDAETGLEIRTIPGHADVVHSVAWDPEGRMLARGGKDRAVVWDALTGDEVLDLGGHTGAVRAVCFSPGGARLELRNVYRREGRYLLRSNLSEEDPGKLWELYIQLVQIEEAFRNLKGDLSIRPVYHQKDERIEAHIFISFLSYRWGRH